MAILFLLLLSAVTITQGRRHEHSKLDDDARQSLDRHVPQQHIAYVNNGSALSKIDMINEIAFALFDYFCVDCWQVFAQENILHGND